MPKLTRNRLRRIIREEAQKLNEAGGGNVRQIRKHLDKIIELWSNADPGLKRTRDGEEFEAKIYDADHFLAGLQ